MIGFALSSERRVIFHASTCFRIGSKLRCIRSIPTERTSTRLACLASTGVNAPGTMFPILESGHSAAAEQGFEILTIAGELTNYLRIARHSVADEVAGRRLWRRGHVSRFRGGSVARRPRAAG